ncbi:hypothetical protein [Halostella salina]|uniref:hypothetical protein n=1 Tax=Halostella salina TaxID=1547897 RepID=UPI0013CF1CE9|nr:hypothetical protein [Halostella salina]
MDSRWSRREILGTLTAGSLIGLAGCNSITARLDRGSRTNTVKKIYQPGDLSATISLEEGQAVSRKTIDGASVRVPHRSVSSLFHRETGEELPLRDEDAPGALSNVSVGYADGIGAPASGTYVCAIVPLMPPMDGQIETDPKAKRKLETFGESGSYKPISENPYPIKDAVELLETARENFGTTPKGYNGYPLGQAGYPIPASYLYFRTDGAGSQHIGVEGAPDPPIDGEVIYVPGNKLFELVTVELVRARTVKSLSESKREEYISRLTALLPAVYSEYGLMFQGRELTAQEDEFIDSITDEVLGEIGTSASRVAERVTEAISDEVGGDYEWEVSEVSEEATVEDPTITATWFLTGESEIDISDDEAQFEPIEDALPAGASPVFDLSVSVPFSCTTMLELTDQFLVGSDVRTDRRLRNAQIDLNYKS